MRGSCQQCGQAAASPGQPCPQCGAAPEDTPLADTASAEGDHRRPPPGAADTDWEAATPPPRDFWRRAWEPDWHHLTYQQAAALAGGRRTPRASGRRHWIEFLLGGIALAFLVTCGALTIALHTVFFGPSAAAPPTTPTSRSRQTTPAISVTAPALAAPTPAPTTVLVTLPTPAPVRSPTTTPPPHSSPTATPTAHLTATPAPRPTPTISASPAPTTTPAPRPAPTATPAATPAPIVTP